MAKFYTGLSQVHRNILWDFLGHKREDIWIYNRKGVIARCLKRLSVVDQFLLCLVKLRGGYSNSEMEVLFKINRKLVGDVVKSLLQFMYKTFKDSEEEMFLQPEVISHPLPKHFGNKLLRKVTAVIDCTEIFVESSTNYRQQGNLFSTYKHHTTAKCLIGVSPSDACTFAMKAVSQMLNCKEEWLFRHDEL